MRVFIVLSLIFLSASAYASEESFAICKRNLSSVIEQSSSEYCGAIAESFSYIKSYCSTPGAIEQVLPIRNEWSSFGEFMSTERDQLCRDKTVNVKKYKSAKFIAQCKKLYKNDPPECESRRDEE